ncbi:MAG: TetR/AcrR family transcriptional regulator [Culicoidibacterales bacterium]
MTNKEKILHAAMAEFTASGYNKTSVNKLIEITGLSKGTFYHYFKSKEEVLDAIINTFTDQLAHFVQLNIEKYRDQNAIEVLTSVLIALNIRNENQENQATDTMIHVPENVLLHQKLAASLIQKLTPEIVRIIEQGVKEELFSVKLPHVMVEILLLTQYLFDENMFHWTLVEKKEKILGIIIALERLLGAKEGSFISYQNYLLSVML